MKYKKKLGVIGGLGPFATVEFLDLLFAEVLRNGAKQDQDYPDVSVEFACSTPDRTSFLCGNTTENPGKYLANALLKLKHSGCHVVGMPCNTAHAFWQELVAANTQNPIILVNMIQETVKAIQRSGANNCLLLATDGTIRNELYLPYFRNTKLNLMMPKVGAAEQTEIMNLIYEIKSGKRGETLDHRFNQVIAKYPEADTLILGCTELPLLSVDAQIFKGYVINPLQILAETMLAQAL